MKALALIIALLGHHTHDTAPAIASAWMPRDTAPMNVRVLAVSKYGSTVIATRTGMGWIVEESVLISIDVSFKITHWMPLPAPPEEIEVSK